jgi:hypothetical protein
MLLSIIMAAVPFLVYMDAVLLNMRSTHMQRLRIYFTRNYTR